MGLPATATADPAAAITITSLTSDPAAAITITSLTSDPAPNHTDIAALAPTPDPAAIAALSTTQLSNDIRIIGEILSSFDGSNGTMIGLTGSAGDSTFADCVGMTCQYDVDTAFSPETRCADQVNRVNQLDLTLSAMQRAGLTGTSDFERTEDDLAQARSTLRMRTLDLCAQKNATQARLNSLIVNIMLWECEASPALLECMKLNDATISETLRTWILEARARISASTRNP